MAKVKASVNLDIPAKEAFNFLTRTSLFALLGL